MNTFQAAVVAAGLIGASAGARAAELQQPIPLNTPGVPMGPTAGSSNPPGSVGACANLAPAGPVVPAQLVVSDVDRPDVGPYTVRLPGYSTGGAPALYRPFLVQAFPGSSIRFDIVNQLDTGSLNENLTNLHTHGLIVPPRPCTPLGDYIFVTDQPGTTTSYRIDVPATLPGNMLASQATPRAYPSGLYWFHGHLHEYTSDEVNAGQSGFLYIGDLLGEMRAAPGLDAATSAGLANVDTLYVGLRDIQLAVPAGVTPDRAAAGQRAQWLTSADYHTDACTGLPSPSNPSGSRLGGAGYCGHHLASVGGQASAQQDTVWMFTVNGQYNPTITMRPGHDQDWRLSNLSANATYLMELDDDATGQPQPVMTIGIDGVVAGTNAPGSSTLKVGVVQQKILLTPGNRVEILVPNAGGASGRHLTLRTAGFNTGAQGDPWPRIDIAHVVMPPGPATAAVPDVELPNAAPSLASQVGSLVAGNVPANCSILPPGQRAHRLITFQDGPSPGEFTLGSKVVDYYDRPIAAGVAQQPFPMGAMTMPNSIPHVCPRLGDQEVWEIVNESGEMHNFHIHQGKFRLTRPTDYGAPAPFLLTPYLDPSSQDGSYYPEVQATAQATAPNQVVDIWRDVIALPPYGGRMFVTIPFYAPQQVGDFVYHCHILRHEEGGMMAVVQVYDPS